MTPPQVTVEPRPDLELDGFTKAFPLQRIAEVMHELATLLGELPNPGLGDRRIEISINAECAFIGNCTTTDLWLTTNRAEARGRLAWQDDYQCELRFFAGTVPLLR